MTSTDKIIPTNDSKVIDDSANVASQKAHSEVFSNPQEFMSVLSANFSKLKGDNEGVSLSDLKIDGEDKSLDPKVRAAAQIAADHFEELQKMGLFPLSGHDHLNFDESVLTKTEIDLAKDVVSDKILGHVVNDTVYGSVMGTAIGVMGLGTAAAGSFVGYGAVAESMGVGMLGLGASFVAGGLAMAGVGAFMGYEGVTTYNRYSQAVKSDQAAMKNWL